MKSTFVKTCFYILSVFILEGCIETFAPPEVTSTTTYLVVDGYLNTGEGSSVITLSRTQNLTEAQAPMYELNAQVKVEGDLGSQYIFTEKGDGSYELPQQTFSETENFRLSIKTIGGKEYVSDYVPYRKTPAIDSVTYKVDDAKGGVQFYANAHDNLNKTLFYRWKFEATWQYQSAFYSSLEVRNDSIIRRMVDISTCWQTEKPSTILLGSSIKLSQDIIRDFPICFVPASTNRLLLKYSILVKQFGLTQDAFEYWTSLAKTTEGTGGLFDPQPSLVTGNLHSTTDNQELVFGYFSVTSMEQKRIFISPYLGVFPRCQISDTLSEVDALTSGDLIMTDYGYPNVQYIMVAPSCADCRTQGGTNVRPDFWQ